MLRFENAWYDGTKVSGRILVGAKGGIVSVKAWAMEGYDFSIENVSDCDSHRRLQYLDTTVVGNLPNTPPIAINPGYWYGKDVMYPLFVKVGPPCIELTIGLLLGARPPAAEVRFTVKKTDGPLSK